EATKPGDFQTADGKKVSVPLMHQVEKFQYGEDENVQVVSLPYQGHALSMVVLLPRKADGLAALEKGLTPDRLEGLLGKLQLHRVTLTLPRFKMTAKFNLERELPGMGMPLAFSDKADFSGMTTRESLFISKVIHKAFVDVDEKGTEAAAAT